MASETQDSHKGTNEPVESTSQKFPLDFQEGCKLFIAQLDFGTQDETLLEEFSKFGKIIDHHIARQNGVSKGYGFVTYDDPRDAEDALERMNHKIFDGREIKIQIAENRRSWQGENGGERDNQKEGGAPTTEPTNKLFIGGLAWEVTSKVLGETFQEFGEVIEARIVMDRLNPTRSKGFGFVEMATSEEAILAQKKMNGQEIGGRAVKVDFDYGENKPKRDGEYRGKGGGKGNYHPRDGGYRDSYRDEGGGDYHRGKGKGGDGYRGPEPSRYSRGGESRGDGYGRADYYREDDRYDSRGKGGGYGRPMGREEFGGGGYGDPREPPMYRDYREGGKGYGGGKGYDRYRDVPPRDAGYGAPPYREADYGGRGGGPRDRYEGGGYDGGYPPREDRRRYDDRPRY